MTTLAELEDDESIALDYACPGAGGQYRSLRPRFATWVLWAATCARGRAAGITAAGCSIAARRAAILCFAVDGSSKYHAILGGADCYIVHPSDLAPSSRRARRNRDRSWSKRDQDSFRWKSSSWGRNARSRRKPLLKPGELLTGVFVPKPAPGQRSVYLKARERQTQEFALSSVAASLHVCREASSNALPWCSVEWPLRHGAHRIRRRRYAARAVAKVDADAVGRLAVRGARPLRDNQFQGQTRRIAGEPRN